MASHITLTPEPAQLHIRANGIELGNTRQALRLVEGSYPAVHYIPRADINMTLLEKTDRQSVCPHKGPCSYYSVKTPTGLLENAVWSYESPIEGMQAIAGHLAFYADKVSVTPA